MCAVFSGTRIAQFGKQAIIILQGEAVSWAKLCESNRGGGTHQAVSL